MTKAAMTLTLPTAFAYLLLAGIEPAEAGGAQVPMDTFYAAPFAVDNEYCNQMQPCSIEGAVMACQASWKYLCLINVSDGLYMNPRVNIAHYKFVQIYGNCTNPLAVILRTSIPNTATVWVQDHATATLRCMRLDSQDGVTGVMAIAGRQHAIIDYGLISFGGSKAPNGALYLGKAFGIIADHYAISGVTLRKGQLHRLTK